jgi:hypothetical protein
VIGLGIGALLSQVANVTLGGVTDEERGSATGVYNTAKELGTSVGTAIIGTAMLAAFFQSFVSSAAIEAGQELPPDEARVVAIQLEDAQQRLDADQLVDLVQTEIPRSTVDDIQRVASDSWTSANRRALESALAVTALTFLASTFVKRRPHPPRRRTMTG